MINVSKQPNRIGVFVAEDAIRYRNMAAKYWLSKRSASAGVGQGNSGGYEVGGAVLHEGSWRAAHRLSNASGGATSAEILLRSRCCTGFEGELVFLDIP